MIQVRDAANHSTNQDTAQPMPQRTFHINVNSPEIEKTSLKKLTA